MKDKELREVLVDAGLIHEHKDQKCSYLEPLNVVSKINAIAKYLGIKFEEVPHHVIAVQKATQQETRA